MMVEPEFDSDGYPTEATLEQARSFQMHDQERAFQFMEKAWKWDDFVGNELRPHEAETIGAKPDRRYWRFATGGWSGNEDLMLAFGESTLARTTWVLSARGGLHIFEELPT